MKTPVRRDRRSNHVTGIRELDRALDKLAKRAAGRVVRAATNQAMTVLAKAIREEIKTDRALGRAKRQSWKSKKIVSTAGLYRRAMARLVGKRFKKRRRQDISEAKVGFGIGAKNRLLPKRSGKHRSRKSVGIGGQNVHWFALGTKNRTRRNGQSTGAIAPVSVVRRAEAQTRTRVKQTMATAVLRGIEREVEKIRAESRASLAEAFTG